MLVPLLAVLELMSGSPRDWSRHVDGCASLFGCFSVTGFSGGLLQVSFGATRSSAAPSSRAAPPARARRGRRAVFADQWARLWDDLQFWLEARARAMLLVALDDGGVAQVFPAILFAYWAAISANQLCHAACNLVLEMRPPESSPSLEAIDCTTGWGALWRLGDLEAEWGYSPDEILAAL